MKHYIFIGSSYTKGKRIGLHFTNEKEMNKVFLKHINYIKKYPISKHMIETENSSWDSVIKNDKFFENIELKRVGEFFKLLGQNEQITSLDVAYYILAKCSCCHTKLEKLVYYCYADYFVKTGKKLFDDKIFAFTYGPVINNVYQKFKNKYDLANDNNIQEKFKELPLRSRILVSENGVDKIYSINETLSKYSDLSALSLTKLTHQPNTPWSNTFDNTHRYKIITDAAIKNFHQNEILQ